jgi:hypothetical protein
MILYEVNIEVEPSLADKYVEWLRVHIDEMRTVLHGIKRVTLAKRDAAEDGWVAFTVVYSVASREDLDDYLANRAARMRQQAMETFGDKFRASRRIMNVVFEQDY